MLAGVVIYVCGGKYLPEQRPARTPGARGPDTDLPPPAAEGEPAKPAAALKPGLKRDRSTLLLLIGIGLAVTIFRGAYEQIGNTVALWADVGVDRTTALMEIPMTWFQSLNPLVVFLGTPLLLAHWKRRAAAGSESSSMQKMAGGALIVAGAYLLLALAAWQAGGGRASWLWLTAYFVIFTFGELHILPVGLGVFARLAPPTLGATTIASWFLAIFSGSLAAGFIGTLWSRMSHALYFVMLAVIASVSAVLLISLDRPTRRIEGNAAAARAAPDAEAAA
jgi:POT family proton-dependent oligopeptide transporter